MISSNAGSSVHLPTKSKKSKTGAVLFGVGLLGGLGLLLAFVALQYARAATFEKTPAPGVFKAFDVQPQGPLTC